MCRSFVLALALTVAGCAGSDGPPSIAIDRAACAHCGMLISDLRYAAALRAQPGAEAQVYDDIGCMVQAWHAANLAADAASWVMDADGTWVEARHAAFVRGAINTPMDGGIVAFRDRVAADQYAATVDGASVLAFEQLTRR